MSCVILIGMPGSGKSTVTDLYARKYGEEVWDTDCLITARHGDISEIFANYGEEYFRDLETEAVGYICDNACDAFIATGGGLVLRDENVRLFKKIGKIVYLRTRLDTLAARLEGDTSRPLLQGGARQRLESLYRARTPIYERAADIIVDTDGLTSEEVLGEIFSKTAL